MSTLSDATVRRMRDRRWGHLDAAPPPERSPWAVPWQRHDAFTDLYAEGATGHFLLRTRVTPENVAKLGKLVECMAAIFALPDQRSPFAWPVLENTWGTP